MKKLVLTAITALGLASVAPAVAQAPSVNLTIGHPGGGPQGTTTTVLFGDLVRVSGELSNGQPNQLVDLTVTPYRGETRVVSLRTDSQGDFEFTHRPAIRTSYEARYGSSTSNQEPYAHVRPNVGLRVLNARRGLFRVTMAARPAHVSRVVWFQRRIDRTQLGQREADPAAADEPERQVHRAASARHAPRADLGPADARLSARHQPVRQGHPVALRTNGAREGRRHRPAPFVYLDITKQASCEERATVRLNLHELRADEWTPAVRAAGLAHRSPYAFRHATFGIAARGVSLRARPVRGDER